VTGAVNDPGTYVASPTTRVSEIIEQAAGIHIRGSSRWIRIER